MNKRREISTGMRFKALPGGTARTDVAAHEVLMMRSVELMRTAIHVFKEALPGTDPELIGGFFADLFDLWETGQSLDEKLQKLADFRCPRDHSQLRDFLIWVDSIQIDMAACWIREIRRDLPKLLRALDRLESQSFSHGVERRSTVAREVKKRNRNHPGANP